MENQVRNVSRAAEGIGLVILIGLVLIVTFPQYRAYVAADSAQLWSFVLQTLVLGGVLFYAAWALRRHSLLAYYGTWLVTLYLIIHMKILGFIFAFILGYLLLKAKPYYMKKN